MIKIDHNIFGVERIEVSHEIKIEDEGATEEDLKMINNFEEAMKNERIGKGMVDHTSDLMVASYEVGVKFGLKYGFIAGLLLTPIIAYIIYLI